MTTGEPAPVRSIFAVAAGFFTTAILSLGGDIVFRNVAPTAFDTNGRPTSAGGLMVMLAYTALFGFVGGYVTARIAIRRPMAHALAVGCLALVFGIATAIIAWSTAPAWYHLTTLVLTVPVAVAGGKLREWQSR